MPATRKRYATKPHLIAFGRRLRQCRLHLNWGQREVASRMAMSTTTVSQYENGFHEPPIRRLSDFATLYGVSADALLGRVPMPTWLCETPAPSPAHDCPGGAACQEHQ